LEIRRSNREEGETWGLAMRILARDIADADEPSGNTAVQDKRAALRQTREK